MIKRFRQWLGLVERPSISPSETELAVAAKLLLDAFRQEHGHDFTTKRFQ